MSLSGARRVVLIAYNPEKGTIDFRHFVITVKPYGVSKRIRRVLQCPSRKPTRASSVIDLGNEKDVADFLLRKRGDPRPDGEGGYESAASSASSVAGDDADAISLADDYVGRNNKRGQKKAVKLDEVGPRIELRLIKISEGVPGKEGGVMYHGFSTSCIWRAGVLVIGAEHILVVKKTKAEAAALRASHAAKRKLKEQRRKEQEENVRRKKEGAAAKQGTELTSEDSAYEGDEYTDSEWDEEEEVSDGEATCEDAESTSESEDSDECEEPSRKRTKLRMKR